MVIIWGLNVTWMEGKKYAFVILCLFYWYMVLRCPILSMCCLIGKLNLFQLQREFLVFWILNRTYFWAEDFPRIHSKQMLKSQSIKLKPWHRIILFGSGSIQLIFINYRQLSMVLLVVLVFVFGYMLCDNYQLQPESFLPRVFCACARLLF